MDLSAGVHTYSPRAMRLYMKTATTTRYQRHIVVRVHMLQHVHLSLSLSVSLFRLSVATVRSPWLSSQQKYQHEYVPQTFAMLVALVVATLIVTLVCYCCFTGFTLRPGFYVRSWAPNECNTVFSVNDVQ